jgi:hypothetical protein
LGRTDKLHEEHKQHITGTSWLNQLAADLWDNTPAASCTECALWYDLATYDHYLVDAVLSRAGVQQGSLPREGLVSMVVGDSYGSASEMTALFDFISKKASTMLRTKAEKREYALDGAPDLSKTIDGSKVFVRPTYDESTFAITKPLADDTLPIRQTVLDKWLSPGVPVLLSKSMAVHLVARAPQKRHQEVNSYLGRLSDLKFGFLGALACQIKSFPASRSSNSSY